MSGWFRSLRWRTLFLIRTASLYNNSNWRMLYESDGKASVIDVVFYPEHIKSISALPGQYQLRLVLSNTRCHSSGCLLGLGGVVDFLSKEFVIVAPPHNGSCHVHPPNGSVSTTLFNASSRHWVSHTLELPLSYRFSSALRTFTEARGPVSVPIWRYHTSWSAAASARNLLFGVAGTLMIRAEARDTLGAVSMQPAVATAVVMEPPFVNKTKLLNIIENVAMAGDAMQTLSAVSAIAAATGQVGPPGRVGGWQSVC